MNGHHKCGHCSVCSLSMLTNKIDFTDLGFTHELTHFSNCNKTMCIYLLICKCTLRYAGSTQWKLKIRLQEHRSHVKNRVLEAPLTQHCLDNRHGFNYFKCIVLETVISTTGVHLDLNKKLLQHETFWITRLRILAPRGLNQEIDYSAVL